MSRRSLRIDDGLLDRSLPRSSASFSVGGASWKRTRSRRSKQLSLSCSDPLLLNSPRKLSSSLHSEASDASLLSSLLDESCVQENTLLDSCWGLDHVDPKKSTILAEQSTLLADRTLIGLHDPCSRQPVQTTSSIHCRDCEPPSDGKEPSYCSASLCATAPETPTIYCRERSRKNRSDVLQLCLDSCLQRVRRAAVSCASALAHTWQACRELQVHTQADGTQAACSSHLGAMNPRGSSTNLRERHPNGALCKTAVSAYNWVNRRWHHMTYSIQLTCSPLRLLLFLLSLLLLLLALSCLAPAVQWSILPAVMEWTVLSDVPRPSSIHGFVSPQSRSAEAAVEEGREEPLYSQPLPEEAAVDDLARLIHLERSVAALWEQVEAGGQRAEQRHREVLGLYADLQQQSGGHEASLSLQLEFLRTRLDEERMQSEQARRQDRWQQSQTSRLVQLELRLQTLAAQTEELQERQEAASFVAASLPAAAVSVEHQAHDALLAEVARLEAALEDVRRDVEGLWVCRDGCRQLDRIQQTISEQVSAQVREELQTLVYGNRLRVRGGASAHAASPQESLLQWLSRHYVSGPDLQASLASLELGLLQNISWQFKQRHSEDTAWKAAVTLKDVHVIVEDALRLFSQDKTGLADYALESGGGSILSTRCSETYETKAALLSLFGVPLWFFSQSPRAVIQPDVHLGNCWAFKGSKGFLVIRLSMRILPTAFSLEHIPKALAPSGTLRSAPRDFSVYGLDDERQERGELLGSYTYDQDGEAVQTFAIAEDCDQTFQIIEVQVLSNWGHLEYTCLYRFRVHGTPATV